MTINRYSSLVKTATQIQAVAAVGLEFLPQPVTIRPARCIGPFTATVVIEETATDKTTITKHPVQQGAQISDHAYNEPSTVVIKAAYSESDKDMPLDEIYNRILALKNARIPFDVVTGKRIYKNMLFETVINATDAATENILSITATLQEVIIVSIGTTVIPARSKQKNAGKTGATEKAGSKNPENESGANDKTSALLGITGGTGYHK